MGLFFSFLFVVQYFCLIIFSMKSNLFVSLSLMLLLGAGCQTTPPSSNLSQNSPTPESNSTVFCSPEGELVRTQTIQSHRSYCLQTQKTEPELNQPMDYSFSVIDDRGKKLTDLKVVHEKLIHVIVVRTDLNQFQHVHPEFNSENGIFTIKNLTFQNTGAYRLYFDFTPSEEGATKVTLTENIQVGDSTNNPKLNLVLTPSPQTVDKFVVRLKNLDNKQTFKSGQETKVTFHIDGKNNAPIEHVENYLGAKGHLVILKEGTLEYLHVHPEEKKLTSIYNDIPFFVTFPEAGKYKLFLEFKHWGKVYHVPYVVEVQHGNGPTPIPSHNTH